MINILWDSSHIWGYLLLHAVQSAGVPFQVVTARRIPQNGISCKLFIVPGGSAKGKLSAFSKEGISILREYIAGGGMYLGFCGGAGLALAGNLGLCPWNRANMPDRLQHMISGHLICRMNNSDFIPPEFRSKKISLPVWWPGRFEEPAEYEGVDVPARYEAADEDFYAADIPFSLIPQNVIAEWRTVYKADIRPSLFDGLPCMAAGNFGKGNYLLSYSHLETPRDDFIGSEHAGRCFTYLLSKVCGIDCSKEIPALDLNHIAVQWEDTVLISAKQELEDLILLGIKLGFFFPRNSWLLGWRTGMPGAQINNLYMALSMTMTLNPTDSRVRKWEEKKTEFRQNFHVFCEEVKSWLCTRRLAVTLHSANHDIFPKKQLMEKQKQLFGSPMFGGGRCEIFLDILESLVFE